MTQPIVPHSNQRTNITVTTGELAFVQNLVSDILGTFSDIQKHKISDQERRKAFESLLDTWLEDNKLRYALYKESLILDYEFRQKVIGAICQLLEQSIDNDDSTTIAILSQGIVEIVKSSPEPMLPESEFRQMQLTGGLGKL